MVESQPMGNPSTTIMSNHGELAEPELRHHVDLVLSHHSLRVRDVVFTFGRLAAISVPAKIRNDESEIVGKLRRNLVPHDMSLGIAVEQQQWRPLASYHHVDRYVLEIDFLSPKIR